MKYFLLYATANDKRRYLEDIENFYDFSRYNTGVGKVHMYVAISEVNTLSESDYAFVEKVKKVFVGHSEIVLQDVFFKSNMGRDFSSYSELFARAREGDSSNNGFVFFRNRSARGPFESDWYARFVEQFHRHSKIAICGNTINMYDHEDRSFDIIPHVQSYAFLSTISMMGKLSGFPGIDKTTRLGVITNGEIALSQKFFDKGYNITSLGEPILAIGNEVTEEVKVVSNMNLGYKFPKGLPFYHYQDLNLLSNLTRLLDRFKALKWFAKSGHL